MTKEVRTWEQIIKLAMSAKHTALNNRLLYRGHPDAVRPPWIIEELIADDTYSTGISCDWKAWVIGGKVELIGQHVRGKNASVCWRDNQFRPVGRIRSSKHWKYNDTLPLP